MQRIGLAFLFVAALNAIIGVSLGIGMGISHDFTLAPVHAHLNLLGWASLALFGLSYQAWPELGRPRLAGLHFAISAPASVLFPLGLYISLIHQIGGLVVAGAFAWLAGALLFAFNVGSLLLRRGARTTHRSERSVQPASAVSAPTLNT